MSQAVESDRPESNERVDGRAGLPRHPRRILVADDDHIIASGLVANLTDLGYSVIGPGRDGLEAVELARQLGPDLALLDIRMPRLDGLAAAREIFQSLGVPVVILSAFSDPDFVDSAQEIGVFGYMLKPVSADQLRVHLTIAWGRYLGSREAGDEMERLRTRLAERKYIEQAKWLIVKRKGIDEPEAMRLLQKHARNNRRTLVDVARALIENEDLFGG